MARGEDQPQAVVGNRAHELIRLVLVAPAERPQLRLERHAPSRPSTLGADPVERAIARRGHDPGRRVVGRSALWPALERAHERILDRLLGAIEIAEDARKDGDRLSGLASEQAVDEDVLRPAGQDAADSEPDSCASSAA
jgi:hypothetical protein